MLSITHGIYTLFDIGVEIGAVFFYNSLAVNKVWQSGSILEFRYAVYGGLLRLLKDFLINQNQSHMNWSEFFLGRCQSRSLPMFYSRAIAVLNVHQWFARQIVVKPKVIRL